MGKIRWTEKASSNLEGIFEYISIQRYLKFCHCIANVLSGSLMRQENWSDGVMEKRKQHHALCAAWLMRSDRHIRGIQYSITPTLHGSSICYGL
jgi:hypothetical protein